MSIFHWIAGDSWRRFVLSLAAALIVYFALRHRLTFPINAVAVWGSFATFSSALAWLAIGITPQNQLPVYARKQDTSRFLIFGFVVVGACVALVAVGLLIRSHRAEMQTGVTLPLCLALGTVAVSWLLLHTVYSLHYAHIYYGDSDGDDVPEGGLEFPNDAAPDYLDFAYFSFVVGMTCQVSDVQVTSKRMRRLTLGHGVISFAYNTFILALLINTVSGLL